MGGYGEMVHGTRWESVMSRLFGVPVWGLMAYCVFFLLTVQEASGREKIVVGWIEKVSITPGLILHAKMDTGADYCSLHVEDIQPFRREGVTWVRFKVTNRIGESISIERKVLRTARIKRKENESQKRYVVYIGICLGDVYKEVQVNLVDRSGFKFHMLIGRNFLLDSFVVDPSLQYTREPLCGKGPAR
jgi:hypothetical protein